VVGSVKGCFKKEGDRHLEDSEPVPFLKRFLRGTASVYHSDGTRNFVDLSLVTDRELKPAIGDSRTWVKN
jgi:hypothetical protein